MGKTMKYFIRGEETRPLRSSPKKGHLCIFPIRLRFSFLCGIFFCTFFSSPRRGPGMACLSFFLSNISLPVHTSLWLNFLARKTFTCVCTSFFPLRPQRSPPFQKVPFKVLSPSPPPSPQKLSLTKMERVRRERVCMSLTRQKKWETKIELKIQIPPEKWQNKNVKH